jgi:multiple sugar transport system ATP-binding protein
LSGGDQQRVALARALVRQPAAFLMDEPLGALDAEFREAMRAEIKRLHIEQGATTVYVTHDQIEAMAMGDKIVVMSAAEVQQVGSPLSIYHDPANLFVARFIGSPGMNLVPGHYHDGVIRLAAGQQYQVPESWRAPLERHKADAEVVLGFRPEAVQVKAEADLKAEVYVSDMHGGYAMLHLDIGQPEIIHARAERHQRFRIGDKLSFALDPEQVRFFDPGTKQAIRKEPVT